MLFNLFFALQLFVGDAFAGSWQHIYTDDGVSVSKKEIEGSPLVAFKGATVLDAPVDRVLYVLMDNDHRLNWVDRLYVNRIIERMSDHEYVLYQAFELPAIFSNRDYVYHGKATRDPDSGAVILTMQSTEHADAPETIGVRAHLTNSRYVLQPLPDGKTNISVEIQTDPQGALPAWLVNLIQRSWPVKTLSGVRGQLPLPHVASYPLPNAPDVSGVAVTAP